jgi:hypothetical protein
MEVDKELNVDTVRKTITFDQDLKTLKIEVFIELFMFILAASS